MCEREREKERERERERERKKERKREKEREKEREREREREGERLSYILNIQMPLFRGEGQLINIKPSLLRVWIGIKPKPNNLKCVI